MTKYVMLLILLVGCGTEKGDTGATGPQGLQGPGQPAYAVDYGTLELLKDTACHEFYSYSFKKTTKNSDKVKVFRDANCTDFSNVTLNAKANDTYSAEFGLFTLQGSTKTKLILSHYSY